MATYLIVPNDSCELSDELRKRIDNLFTKEEDKFYFAKNNACFVQYDMANSWNRERSHFQRSPQKLIKILKPSAKGAL